MDCYRFSYSIYHRPFRRSLFTSHGEWKIRSGIIVRLTDERGRAKQGEIAPIPWFGSESLASAIEWCQQIGDTITTRQIYDIPDNLPACQFGCGSALTAFTSTPNPPTQTELAMSALLPAGATAIECLPALVSQGYTTFKWKIGVLPIAQELAIWARLMAALLPGAKLRLDANGGLNYALAEQWLAAIAGSAQIEFIEQPLAPNLLAETIELARKYTVPIALDESVATFDRLQATYTSGWRGIYVIKPGIAGFPWQLAEFINRYQLDVVFSSVLETNVGKTAAMQLASKLNLTRSMGFGVDDWFE
ncbi:o-succinylbenzoate synthase [Chamaesiphon sp. VAR_48_metabat_403]|uniref:o-succinylbenzoate synthase n=1 Tax=Chamaesiphon sp. VAR_48_metabat_403 TaxID=2964700 RepID=UPI00286E44E4|nr:o-succinylbenzoate synthase [Chamaesiphon sp. VAR_48_metabat_403]